MVSICERDTAGRGWLWEVEDAEGLQSPGIRQLFSFFPALAGFPQLGMLGAECRAGSVRAHRPGAR